MSDHALFSPSSMDRILSCPGSLALGKDQPNRGSVYAAEGTAAHQLLEWALTDGKFNAFAYQGRIIHLTEGEGVLTEHYEFEADEEMCGYVQGVVDTVLVRMDMLKQLGDLKEITLIAEQKIDISYSIGVPDQFGTCDIAILATYHNRPAYLSVEDLKYGRGVAVFPEENPQLMTYALGVYDELSIVEEISQIGIVVHQPRLDYVGDWETTPERLTAFREELRNGAEGALSQISMFEDTGGDIAVLELNPNEKACKFCPAKGICPALAGKVFGTITGPASVDDFENLDEAVAQAIPAVKQVDEVALAAFMDTADLIEEWLKGVRAEVETRLLLGGNASGIIPGYMLGQGRKGHRKFRDASEAEEAMKSMRLKQDEMYTRKLISPTQAEKVLKDSPRRWSRLQELITQNEGKPSVVREDDPKAKRYEIEPVENAFDDLDAVA